MSKKILCPACNNTLNANEQLKYKIRFNQKFLWILFYELFTPWKDGLGSVYKSNIVTCPSCGKQFKWNDYKYFGFLDNKAFQKIIICFIIFFMFFPLFILLWRFL